MGMNNEVNSLGCEFKYSWDWLYNEGFSNEGDNPTASILRILDPDDCEYHNYVLIPKNELYSLYHLDEDEFLHFLMAPHEFSHDITEIYIEAFEENGENLMLKFYDILKDAKGLDRNEVIEVDICSFVFQVYMAMLVGDSVIRKTNFDE